MRMARWHKLFNSYGVRALLMLLLLVIVVFVRSAYILHKFHFTHPNTWPALSYGHNFQAATKFDETATFRFTSDVADLDFPKSDAPLSDNVTLVSAFFNIGAFQKGTVGMYNVSKYARQAAKFSRVKNFVVLYSDDEAYLKAFESHRKEFKDRTKLILVNQSDLWSFKNRDLIAKIYANSFYPKHHPNTVVPEYSCAMSAKYEVVSMAMEANYFKSSYFAWIDQGYFREFAEAGEKFTVGKPPGFDNRTVCFAEIFQMLDANSARNIFLTNNVWIGGGYFLAHHEVMTRFIQQYKQYTHRYLSQGYSSSDQQVLYAVYWEHAKNGAPAVPLQVYYTRSGRGDPWFWLGKISIVEKYYHHLLKH